MPSGRGPWKFLIEPERARCRREPVHQTLISSSVTEGAAVDTSRKQRPLDSETRARPSKGYIFSDQQILSNKIISLWLKRCLVCGIQSKLIFGVAENTRGTVCRRLVLRAVGFCGRPIVIREKWKSRLYRSEIRFFCKNISLWPEVWGGSRDRFFSCAGLAWTFRFKLSWPSLNFLVLTWPARSS